MSRGYFAIGAQGVSKMLNLGALVRTAHAFGASFAFTVGSRLDLGRMRASDTSDAALHLPVYAFDEPGSIGLPAGCDLVGLELTDEAVDLPSFRHPLRAAYVLGAERGGLTPDLVERCEFVVRIPTRFSVNLAVAGALVMYDRMISLGRFAERPVSPGGPYLPRARAAGHGSPRARVRKAADRDG